MHCTWICFVFAVCAGGDVRDVYCRHVPEMPEVQVSRRRQSVLRVLPARPDADNEREHPVLHCYILVKASSVIYWSKHPGLYIGQSNRVI